MNRLRFFAVVLLLVMLTATDVISASVLVIVGNLKATDDQAISDTFSIHIRNDTRGVEANSKSDTAWKYTVSFVAMGSQDSQ